MRPILLSLLCLTNSIYALTVNHVQRDTKGIETSLSKITVLLDKFTATLKSITPGMLNSEVQRQWPEVDRVSHEVYNTIRADAASIQNGPSVSSFESTKLFIPIENLEAATDRTVNQWIQIKSEVVTDLARANDALDILRHHKDIAVIYADTILGKQEGWARPLVGSIGAAFANNSNRSIQRAITAYTPYATQFLARLSED